MNEVNDKNLTNMILETDLFVKYFQKPTQIYKYIAERTPTAKIFLYRNVSYLRHRMSRNNSARDGASIEEIARTLMNKHNRRYATYHHSIANGRTVNVNTTRQAKDDCNKSQDEVTYNFICNKKITQETRYVGYSCPWCYLDARYAKSLMCHLNNCHMRFKFECVETDEGCRIDITLNEEFDGSYCGFKYPGHDLHHDFRFAPKKGPQARFSRTRTLFFRYRTKKIPKEPLQNGKNNDGNDRNTQSVYYNDGEVDIDDVCGGRLYYHTSTCLPIKPNEVDLDSEADNDPNWLIERSKLMIDEFTDVNNGEKEIMKMWNEFNTENFKLKSDMQMPQVCLDFVQKYGKTIIAKNLYKNYTLHLANIFDFGLMSSADVIECIRNIKKFKKSGKRNERNGQEINCQPPAAKRASLNSY